MLIFVSDLHLADHKSRTSFQPSALFDAIRSCVEENKATDDRVKLVLLGDIFEMLKSDIWIRENVRPWDTADDKLSKTGLDVLENIHNSNKAFFDGLKALQRDYALDIEYMAGNHDALMDDENIVGVRKRLREMIPLIPGIGGSPDECFRQYLVDSAHGVVAEHGHELDSFNCRVSETGRFVPGDAVVIELLVRFPQEVATQLGYASPQEDQFNDRVGFLQELDNVEPQSLAGLLRWVEWQMDRVPKKSRREIEKAVSGALVVCGNALSRAMRKNGSKLWAARVLRALTIHRAFTRVWILRLFATLPSGTTDEISEVADRVSLMAPINASDGQMFDLYVAGHTHAPRQQGFAIATGRQMTYLNTGTWRRVQAPVRTLGGIGFQEHYHETLLCVHPYRLRPLTGRYEFRQNVRGR